MGKFKLKSPYKLDPVPRYEVPFQPDNINDDTGLVAKANKNGTMIVNKNIPKNDPIRKEAESHEDHHIKDIMDGKLDYDENKVYETISTGKVKEHLRENFNESDKNLAWEKDAYKAGENLEQKDMRPKPDKLSGPPNMYEQDTPLAFQKIGSRHKVGRTSDENRISHTERFGPSMEKPNRAGRSKKSGVLNGKFNNFYATGPSLWKGPSAITDKPSGVSSNTDISGNLEKEPKVKTPPATQAVDVDRPSEQIGGNVNYMIRDGYQPRGEYVNNERGVRVVKYVNKKGDAQYHQFNNNADSKNKLHREIDAERFRKLAFNHGEGFVNIKDLEEIDSSGAGNQAMTDQVTKGKMAGNFEAKP